jgi:hypothetical protein
VPLSTSRFETKAASHGKHSGVSSSDYQSKASSLLNVRLQAFNKKCETLVILRCGTCYSSLWHFLFFVVALFILRCGYTFIV